MSITFHPDAALLIALLSLMAAAYYASGAAHIERWRAQFIALAWVFVTLLWCALWWIAI